MAFNDYEVHERSMMAGNIVRFLTSSLEPLMKNRVYTVRSGIAKGLKRRGGLGFIPRNLSREHAFLKNLQFTGKIVYDVGGYVGLMTLFFAVRVGEKGQVVTFEPNRQNYDAIHDNLELNGLTNVRVIPLGLGSKQETLKFVVSDSRPGWGTADPRKQEQLLLQDHQARLIEIQIDTLDHQIAVSNLPKPDFVKIDVEGLELDVLRGMDQTIHTFRPEMHIELHGTNEQEIVEFLLAHHYRVYQIEDGVEITLENIESVRGHLYVY